MDEQGRVYVASTIRAAENQPAWCREGSDNRYAQYFPLRSSSKHVAMYDPETDEMTLIDTCFRADHNDFGTRCRQSALLRPEGRRWLGQA